MTTRAGANLLMAWCYPCYRMTTRVGASLLQALLTGSGACPWAQLTSNNSAKIFNPVYAGCEV